MIFLLLLFPNGFFHIFELNLPLEFVDLIIIKMSKLVLVDFDLEFEEFFLLFEVGFTLTDFENLVL
jgi:hypothetical protein